MNGTEKHFQMVHCTYKTVWFSSFKSGIERGSIQFEAPKTLSYLRWNSLKTESSFVVKFGIPCSRFYFRLKIRFKVHGIFTVHVLFWEKETSLDIVKRQQSCIKVVKYKNTEVLLIVSRWSNFWCCSRCFDYILPAFFNRWGPVVMGHILRNFPFFPAKFLNF